MTVSTTRVDTGAGIRTRRPPFGLPALAWTLGGVPPRCSSRRVRAADACALPDPGAADGSDGGGCVVAAVGIGDFGSQLLGGWLGDRFGRRQTMLLGFLGTSIALVALGSADTTPVIWAAAVGYGLIAGLFRPAGSAPVADLPPEQRVRAYSLLYWAANLGYAIAATAAVVLVSHGYSLLFWLNAVAMLAAALIVVAAVPETRSASSHPRRALLPALLGDRLMFTMALIHVAYFTLLMQAFATLPLLMTAQGHGAAAYGAVLALDGLAIVILQPLAVVVLAHRDRGTVLATSMLLAGPGGGLAAVTQSSAGFAARSSSSPSGRSGWPSSSAPRSLTWRRLICAADTWASLRARGASASPSARWPARRCWSTPAESGWAPPPSLRGSYSSWRSKPSLDPCARGRQVGHDGHDRPHAAGCGAQHGPSRCGFSGSRTCLRWSVLDGGSSPRASWW
nr:MFS transporter [Nonomuraea turkmeniaca]